MPTKNGTLHNLSGILDGAFFEDEKHDCSDVIERYQYFLPAALNSRGTIDKRFDDLERRLDALEKPKQATFITQPTNEEIERYG